MPKFETEVIDRLARIETKLDSDYRTLHGNGKLGLIHKHDALDDRVLKIETSRKTWGMVLAVLATILTVLNGFCATYIAILALNKQNKAKEQTQNESARHNSKSRRSNRSRKSESEANGEQKIQRRFTDRGR